MCAALAGRTEELAVLEAAYARARSGQPATVLIGGEAGVGKSRLVTEFIARLPAAARILRGGCIELGGNGLPFAPFTAALRGLVRDLLDPRGEDSEFARARLFEQILALLDAVTDDCPGVLVVEDVHWADRSSQDLLSFLVRNQQATPALLTIVTYRTADHAGAMNSSRSLLADLGRVDWVVRRDLAPLTKGEVSEQLRGLLGREPDVALRDAIYRRSEGNPLFVEALLSSVDETGAPVPAPIRDQFIALLRQLDRTAQGVVRAMALGGPDVGHLLLAEVTGLDDAALSTALRAAISADLITVHDSRYVFRHALIREVVGDDLLPGERARLHTRYAEALESDPALAAPGRAAVELAQHWYAAPVEHAARALSAAWLAAEDVGAALAYAEQLHLLTHVIHLWHVVPDASIRLGVDHGELLETAVAAALSAGEAEQATGLIEGLLAELDVDAEPARVARALSHRGELRYTLGAPGDIEDLRRAAQLVPAGDSAAAAILNALANRLLTIPLDEEGQAIAAEAIRCARATGDTAAELSAVINLAYSLGRSGDLDRQLDVLAEARTTALGLGHHAAVMHACRCESDLLQDAGRHEHAAQAARRGLMASARDGLSRTSGPTHAGNLAEALVSVGHWDEATDVLEHALESDPAPSLRAYLMVLRGSIALARGQLTATEEAVEYARDVFSRGTTYAQDHLLLVALDAELRLAQGHPQDTLRLVADALPGQHQPRYLWPVLVSWARATTALDSLAEVEAQADRLPVIGPVQRAHQLTLAAEVDRSNGATALAAWDRAAGAWAAVHEPYPLTLALLRAAETAAGVGDLGSAAERLGRASTHARPLAAPPLQDRITRLARLARIHTAEVPSADPTADGTGLTPREREVLQLIARGRSNRQIADELFISIKTVSVHVSNILAKLQVDNRIQAATTAHRMNLLKATGIP